MPFLLGGGIALGLLAGVIVIEALILLRFSWAKLKICFRDSLIVNIVSAILLLLLSQLFLQIPNVLLQVAAAYLLAIVAEGFVLILITRRTAARCYLASLVINTAGFIFLLVYILSFALA